METKFIVKKYDELTPWFDFYKVDPVHMGEYEVRYSEDGCYLIRTFAWTGEGWGVDQGTFYSPLPDHYRAALFSSPQVHWRGLAHSPAKRIALRVKDSFNNFLKKIC